MKNKYFNKKLLQNKEKIKSLILQKRQLENMKVEPMSAESYMRARKINIIDSELLKLKTNGK